MKPGRPATGRTKATRSLAIDLDLLAWLEPQTSDTVSLSSLVNQHLREAKNRNFGPADPPCRGLVLSVRMGSDGKYRDWMLLRGDEVLVSGPLAGPRRSDDELRALIQEQVRQGRIASLAEREWNAALAAEITSDTPIRAPALLLPPCPPLPRRCS